jgi:hypothetical protein
MLNKLQVSLQSAFDSRAVLELAGITPDAVPTFSAALYGPTCAYARTLPTHYSAAAPLASGPGESRTEILLPDPCYWTPALPFLYDLDVRWRDPAGKEHQDRRTIGLRRLTARKASLYWEGQRIVLRGARLKALKSEILPEARAAEVALIVPNPSDEHCNRADLHGIPLVADLRESDEEFENLLRLANHPSVALLLIDGGQIYPCDLPRLPPGTLLAAAIYPDDDPAFTAQTPPDWCNVIGVELQPGTRPPSWIADCGKPAIAMAAAGTYADFHAARVACDHLQAALAPEFDLAGYFT